MRDNLKWDTQIKGLTKREMYALGWEIFYYCRNVLKMKPRGNVYPYLHIYPRKRTESYGEYSSSIHLVEIYAAECNTLRRFVDTVIHEYTHSCQGWVGVNYSAYNRKFGYYKNPFEIEARKVARKNRTSCIKYLQGVYGQ
jgi:hypothetical protein